MTDVSESLFEIAYANARLARVRAPDIETAKRRFAAYVLYDDTTFVYDDVTRATGDDAQATPWLGPAPVTAAGDTLRAWLAEHDARTQAFDVGLYEDPQRAIEPYLRLLATNDPWRLEGHGSLGRMRSALPATAVLATFDGRIAYAFEAAYFFDYVREDVVRRLDPQRPQESVAVASLVDVCGLHDDGLRQIASAYDTIANERRLTARFASGVDGADAPPYGVLLDEASWSAYLAHRAAEPARFSPPPGWRPSFTPFEGS